RDEQPLLLAARERHEPGVTLVCQTELLEEAIAVGGLFSVQRRPQVNGLPHLDPLLELGLLQLDAYAPLELVDAADRIQAQHRDGAAIRPAQTLDALHGRRLAGAVGADQAEDL